MNAPTNSAAFDDAKNAGRKAADSNSIGRLLAIILASALQRDRTDQPSPAPEADNCKAEAPSEDRNLTILRSVHTLGSVLLEEMPERLSVPDGEDNPAVTAARVLLEQKYEILALRKQIEAMGASHMIETDDGMVCPQQLIVDMSHDLIGKQAVIEFLSDQLGLVAE